MARPIVIAIIIGVGTGFFVFAVNLVVLLMMYGVQKLKEKVPELAPKDAPAGKGAQFRSFREVLIFAVRTSARTGLIVLGSCMIICILIEMMPG